MAGGWKNWRGEIISRIVNSTVKQSIEDTCHVVLSASSRQVPLREGILLRSGFVKIIDQNNKIIGVISYGGGSGTGSPKIPYAVRWHENSANFQHGRKKRYLADPYNQLAARTLESFLISRLRRVL